MSDTAALTLCVLWEEELRAAERRCAELQRDTARLIAVLASRNGGELRFTPGELIRMHDRVLLRTDDPVTGELVYRVQGAELQKRVEELEASRAARCRPSRP